MNSKLHDFSFILQNLLHNKLQQIKVYVNKQTYIDLYYFLHLKKYDVYMNLLYNTYNKYLQQNNLHQAKLFNDLYVFAKQCIYIYKYFFQYSKFDANKFNFYIKYNPGIITEHFIKKFYFKMLQIICKDLNKYFTNLKDEKLYSYCQSILWHVKVITNKLDFRQSFTDVQKLLLYMQDNSNLLCQLNWENFSYAKRLELFSFTNKIYYRFNALSKYIDFIIIKMNNISLFYNWYFKVANSKNINNYDLKQINNELILLDKLDVNKYQYSPIKRYFTNSFRKLKSDKIFKVKEILYQDEATKNQNYAKWKTKRVLRGVKNTGA